KTRFGDRISFNINIDSHISEYRIPSMILQPIVENAVVHGVELLKEGGRIIIAGKKEMDSNIYFSVIDNGVGFPDHILELFKSHCEVRNNTLGLGLLNTHVRIQHMFGPEYGITITSEPYVSNCVTIKVPPVN
ncbi:MAG TPA: ATP-binding protein, partial [Anaerovoracaceae bacterium]|nr:ATP-binding protein [Anaerovoracaceae bacterium]